MIAYTKIPDPRQEHLNEIIGSLIYFDGLDPDAAVVAGNSGFVFNELNYVAAVRRCEREGHALVSDDHADGESGSMGAHCRRCGYSFHHQLY